VPGATDFRLHSFDLGRVQKTARSVAGGPYWKLYAAENLLRVVVHSVLTAQIGPHWWQTTKPDLQKQATRFATRFANSPWYGTQGKHPIYYAFLGDLADIMRDTSGYFLPVLPDVDQWIARIDQVELPRNVVGHMNFPSAIDRKRIDVFHHDVRALVARLQPIVSLSIP